MPSMSSDIGGFGEFGELWVWPRHCFWLTSTFVIIRDLPLTWFLLWNHDKPMSLKFRLLGFLSRNTLSRKHDVGVLFTWAKVYFQRRAVVPVKTYLKERTRCSDVNWRRASDVTVRRRHAWLCSDTWQYNAEIDPAPYRATGWRKKTGPPAILSHCKYSENSMTDLHWNCWTSAILYAEHSH